VGLLVNIDNGGTLTDICIPQGTNALVQRKGPRLGLIHGGSVSAAGVSRDADEEGLKRPLLRAFPLHLLGAVPILYSRETTGNILLTRAPQ
jgi:hypothetical protein